MSTTQLLSRGPQQLLRLFLAEQCPLCQRSTPAALCLSCCRQVRQCQNPTPCDRSQPGLSVVSWGHYEGSLRQLIGSLKYSGRTNIAQFLGTELGQLWLGQQSCLGPSPRSVAIVPIPLHPAKLQQRGFNQADLIAQWFCRLTRLPLYSHGLRRTQATQAQHNLSRSQRQQNLTQAFTVDLEQVVILRQATVWLIDDIYTTGATAQSAAQTLRRSGISVGGICTVARAIAWNALPSNSASQTYINPGIDLHSHPRRRC